MVPNWAGGQAGGRKKFSFSDIMKSGIGGSFYNFVGTLVVWAVVVPHHGVNFV